jgi:hypothetical protein
MNRLTGGYVSVAKIVWIKWAGLFFIFVLAVITYLWITGMEQFYVVDQQALSDPDFLQSERYWKQTAHKSSLITFSGDSVNIEHGALTGSQVVQKLIVKSPLFLRLSVDASGKEITTTGRPFAGGSVALVLNNEDGSKVKNTVMTIDRSMPIRNYSDVFYIDETVASVAVAIRLLGAKGVFTVQNPELSVLAEFPVFETSRMVLATFWCIVGCFLIYWGGGHLPRSAFLFGGGLVFAVVVGVLMPGGTIAGVNKVLFGMLPSGTANSAVWLHAAVVGLGGTQPWSGISKVGHFLAFFLIGVLLGRYYRKIGVLYGISLVVVFAIVTEVLQLLVFARSTSIRDVYIDSAGGVLGLLCVVAYVLAAQKFRGFGGGPATQ